MFVKKNLPQVTNPKLFQFIRHSLRCWIKFLNFIFRKDLSLNFFLYFEFIIRFSCFMFLISFGLETKHGNSGWIVEFCIKVEIPFKHFFNLRVIDKFNKISINLKTLWNNGNLRETRRVSTIPYEWISWRFCSQKIIFRDFDWHVWSKMGVDS